MDILTNTWIENLLLASSVLFLIFIISTFPMNFLRVVGRIAVNCGAGLVVLTIFNLFAGWSQVVLPFNELTLGISAILGIPGVLALITLAVI